MNIGKKNLKDTYITTYLNDHVSCYSV